MRRSALHCGTSSLPSPFARLGGWGVQSDSENKDDIAKVFRLFDEDETGRITIANLRRVAKELGETVTDVCSVLQLNFPPSLLLLSPAHCFACV